MKVQKIFGIVMLFTVLVTSKMMAQGNENYYLFPNASFELLMLSSYIDEENYEDPFKFDLIGFFTFGIEARRGFEFGDITIQLRYGESVLKDYMEENGGFNGDIELQNYVEGGLGYQKNFWENNKERKFRFGLKYKTSVSLNYYKGLRVFDNEDYSYRIENFSITTIGAQGGLAIFAGLRKGGENSKITIEWEPFYLRVATNGYVAGLQKIGLSINF